jgi:hypothetical protein
MLGVLRQMVHQACTDRRGNCSSMQVQHEPRFNGRAELNVQVCDEEFLPFASDSFDRAGSPRFAKACSIDSVCARCLIER